MHGFRLVALDEDRLVAIAFEQLSEVFVGNARQKRRVGDLVAVQMQDRQDGAIAGGIEKLVGMPACSERSGFSFAVTHHAGDDQVRVVEGRAIGMDQRIAEFAAFMDRSGCFRGRMARYASGEGKLPEQPMHALGVFRNVRIDLAIDAFEPGIGHHARSAMARSANIDDAEIALLDHPVEMRIDEVQPRRRAPMAEQARLDMLRLQRFAQERIVEKIDLPDR